MRCTLVSPSRNAAALAAVLALGILPVGRSMAQVGCIDQVPEEEWSDMARLATHSMMIDLVNSGEALYAVGDRGEILVSRDGGRSWTQQATPTRSMLTAIWFATPQLGWAVGHDAVIMRTENGGETWCRVHWDPDVEKPLFDVWFADEMTGFAVGAYGYYLRTTDGGVTWTEEVFDATDVTADTGGEGQGDSEESWDEDFNLGGDFHLNKIIPAGGSRLFIAAEAGTIYRSDDQGETWLQLPSPYDGSFFSGVYLGEDSLLIFGLRGNLFRTDDAGMTWRQIELPSDRSLFGGTRFDDGSVLVVGASGVILVSREGQSFRMVQRPDRQVLMTLQPAGSDGLVLVGEPGVERLERSELAAP